MRFKRFEKICGIIIDEYSMISLVDLYWINKRLQQAMKNNKLFGGIPIAFIGDPGQLPPVGGLSVWANRSSNRPLSGNQLEASMAYMKIKNVIKLHTVQRQSDPSTLDFLLAIRDGTIEERHWRWFNDRCSEQAIRQRGDISRFETSNCVHIYSTNKEVFEYNHRCLQKLGKPINKLTARHDSSQSKTRPSDTCEQLPPVLYLTIDSSVMLLRNFMTHFGLVNGSCGLVKDFIYGEDASLPQFIVIDFPSYSGPPFFSRQEQRTWVPLPTFVYHWGENNKHFRESFPITLSYAITIHKSQGMTITHPVWVSLGDKEIEHGQTYVALSRVTDFQNLCIGAGVSLQRLLDISKGTKLKVRLNEDIRLDTLVTQTKERFQLT
jgi:ATP-dependent DNA helicase PIF1